ncbi:c-type cytochrome [Paracraurococcus lichenis]|uniref:Cytochrome c domain-containing protein n=1 Tax=Paracraurococcus lichenis TaxID=3064888 RepID=A0ABT9DWX5_9PROT|nr:c-type cytochrome [Paracraurococcus sp. LOR1-02]MDO9708400.1 hypothetical protein [Paracraurococcus sp. LOR1-02]
MTGAGRLADNRTPAALAMLALLAAGAPASAQDAVQDMAKSCFTCHGPLGVSTSPLIPIIAGQNARYLSGAMKAYRDGLRGGDPSKMMVEPMRGMTDAAAEALAAFFAGVKGAR